MTGLLVSAAQTGHIAAAALVAVIILVVAAVVAAVVLKGLGGQM